MIEAALAGTCVKRSTSGSYVPQMHSPTKPFKIVLYMLDITAVEHEPSPNDFHQLQFQQRTPKVPGYLRRRNNSLAFEKENQIILPLK